MPGATQTALKCLTVNPTLPFPEMQRSSSILGPNIDALLGIASQNAHVNATPANRLPVYVAGPQIDLPKATYLQDDGSHSNRCETALSLPVR